MANYTLEIRELLESLDGQPPNSSVYADIDGMINNGRQLFGDFPIFDERYRAVLTTGILRHYFFWEIGYETVSAWRFAINTKLNEIMPYYNKLYETEQAELDLLLNMDYTVEHSGGKKDNTISSTSNQSKSKNTTSSTDYSNTTSTSSDSNSTGESTKTNTKDNGNETITKSAKKDETFENGLIVTKTKDGSEFNIKNGKIKHMNDYKTEFIPYTNRHEVKTFNGGYEDKTDTLTTNSNTPQGQLTAFRDNKYLTNVDASDNKTKRTYNNYTEDLSVTYGGGMDTTTYTTTDISDNYEDLTDEKKWSLGYNEKDTNSGKTTTRGNNNETDSHNTSHNTLTSGSKNGYTESNNVSDATSSGGNNSSSSNASTDSSNTTSELNSLDNYLNKYKGRNGVLGADALLKARETFINIDLMVYCELEECFMGIW